MNRILTFSIICFLLLGTVPVRAAETTDKPVFRIGIIGTTTSHVPAAIDYFNQGKADSASRSFRVTGVFSGGMPDNPASWDRHEKYAKAAQDAGITRFETIPDLLNQVDGVMLESVDGRCHLEQVKPVLAAGKPVFIDKPLAGCLPDALEIIRLAEENHVPVFSSSSLRYASKLQTYMSEKPQGTVYGCDATGPGHLEPHHPDLYWYGIHTVETLFTVMGPNCVSVSRTHVDGADFVAGVWSDGRIGTARCIRQGNAPYRALIFAEKGVQDAGGYEGYEPLFSQVAAFFESGTSPLPLNDTLMILAFMTAADVSRDQNGASCKLADVLDTARNEKSVTWTVTLLPDKSMTLTENGPSAESEPETVTPDILQKKIDEKRNEVDRLRLIIDNRTGTLNDQVSAVFQIAKNTCIADYRESTSP